MAGRETIGRTILVVEEQPHLWAVLRREVEPATAYVRSATPAELPAAWRCCRPWPWLVVATTSAVPEGLPELLGPRPIALHWLGRPPAAVAGRALAHPDWMALAADLRRLNDLARHGHRGVRLMRNRGLLAPDGRVVLDVAAIEGLMGAPGGLPLPTDDDGRTLSAARAEIDAAGLPLRLERDGDRVRVARL